MKSYLPLFIALLFFQLSVASAQLPDRHLSDTYTERFNQTYPEWYSQYIPDKKAKDFLAENIPFFECPDKEIEEIYYFRWWTYRKHIKQTPSGFIITEFLPTVSWAGKHNGISCPAWFHFREGRWLHDSSFLTDYAYYWMRGGGDARSYSFPIAHAIRQLCLVTGEDNLLDELYPDLQQNFSAWQAARFDKTEGLFWQTDNRDGMEMSIGGSGFRATINSYMAAEALTLADIASQKGDTLENTYRKMGMGLSKNMFGKLWDTKDGFLKVMRRDDGGQLQNVKELHGYTPWAFGLATPDYDRAWRYLMDPHCFFAPYGPTSADQGHPQFQISYEGHECQWNGPSWPFATAMTLTGVIELLHSRKQDFLTVRDFFQLMKQYAKSQHMVFENGHNVPWIDENLNPFTGDWIARTRLKGTQPKERGMHYNHSSFCDLVITGLVGVSPQSDGTLVINPLIPEDTWEYFCLNQLTWHGKQICILYDKTGKKYHQGKGLRVMINGKVVAKTRKLKRLHIRA